MEENGQCIVTPQEAVEWFVSRPRGVNRIDVERLFRTVATEPDRIRAAVVEALYRQADRLFARDKEAAAREVTAQADAIKNGADL